MNNNLPIIATFLEALSFPYKHYRMLLKVGLPLIITGGLLVTCLNFLPDVERGVQLAFTLIVAIAFLLSLAMAIVGCHRIFLLENSPSEESSLLNWTGNEIKYICWGMILGLCATLITLPFAFVSMPFITALFENQSVFLVMLGLISIPSYYVVSRLSLVLPSSAIGVHGKSLKWSWELSSGNGWRLTLLIGFFPFVTDLIFNLLRTSDSILFTLLHGALWLIIGVIEIGLLSLSYRFLVSNENSDNENE